MRRSLIAWCLLLVGVVCIAQSERVGAFWQSRDSNYNQSAITVPPVGVQASRAKAFTNSVGMGDPNNVGGNTVGAALAYMGITTARSDVPIPGDGGSNYNYLAGIGVYFDFLWANDYLTYSGVNNASAISQTFSLIDTFVTTYPGAMLANEGPNETNNFPVWYVQTAATNNSTSTSSAVLHFATTPPELVTAANATYTDGGTVNVGSGFTVVDTTQTIDPGSNYADYALNTSVQVTITINSANEFLVAFTATNSGAITGISDTLGLPWSATPRATTGTGQPEEEFTVAGPTGGSYPQTDTITFTAPSGYIAAGVIGIVGANLSSPFDGSAVTGTSDPLSISTSHTNTVVLAGFRTATKSAPTSGSGWTQIFNGFYTLNEYQLLSSTQSGLSATLAAGNGAGDANGGIVDAIVLNGPPRLAAIPANTSIVSATSTSVTLSANTQNGGVQSGDVIQFYAIGVEPSTNVPVTASSLAWQASIYNATEADANLTGVNVANYTGYVPGATPNPPSVAGTATYNNTHFYPGASQPVPYTGAASMAAALNPANQPIPGIVTVITETGWCTPSAQIGAVDQTTQAIYLLNNYFDMFSAGAPYTLVYTLFDGNTGDSSCFDNYGLFQSNGTTPKTAATAIKNMQTVLNDSGGTALTFSPGKLNYSIAGLASGGSGGFSQLLQKSNGTFEILVWNEPQIWNDTTHTEVTPPTSALTVNLGLTAATVNIYDPMAGATPISTASNVSSVTPSITKDPLIVEVIPPTFSVSAPVPAGVTASPSLAMTVNLNSGTFNGSQTITIADGSQGGTITPSVGSAGTNTVTVTPTNGTSSFTFTYNAASTGNKSLTFSNGQGWFNPNPLVYYANTAANWFQTSEGTNGQWTQTSGFPTCSGSHGTCAHSTYHSNIMNQDVGFNIYLPPGYSGGCGTRYPVLYFLHGINENENTDVPIVEPYADAQIVATTAKPMILVFPNNSWHGEDSEPGSYAYGAYMAEATIIYEMIPYIDATYCTKATKAGRALQGFSAGGIACDAISFAFPQLFGSVYCIAPAIDDTWGNIVAGEPDAMANMYSGAAFTDDVRFWASGTPQSLIYQNTAALISNANPFTVAIGSSDGLLSSQQPLFTSMDALGIPHNALVTISGCGHDLTCDEANLSPAGANIGFASTYFP